MDAVKRFAVLLFVMAFAVTLIGCAPAVSRENYDRIETGMTEQQVRDILGEPDEVDGGGVSLPGVEATASVATWRDNQGREITVTFVNGKVTTKTQRGL